MALTAPKSNARAIQGNSESITRLKAKMEALVEQSQRTEATVENLSIKLDRLSDIVLGNYRSIVRVETGNNNEGAWLDAMQRLNVLERKILEIEQRRLDND
jgi:hypothetical protein